MIDDVEGLTELIVTICTLLTALDIVEDFGEDALRQADTGGTGIDRSP